MNFLFQKRLVKMNYLTNIILILILGYFIFLVLTYIFQRNLLYHPKVNNYSGESLLINVEKIKIKTSDGINLISWYYKKNLN